MGTIGNTNASLNGQWSRNFDECVNCHKTDSQHKYSGWCKRCLNNKHKKERTARKNEKLSSVGKEGIDFIICMVCKKPFPNLYGNGHLKLHNMTEEEYKIQFPNSQTRCIALNKKIAESVSKSRKDLFS